MSRCATTTWRGVTVCVHSVAKLNAWASATGSIYIKPIQGCYSTAVAASTGTHAGGGVYDIEMDPYSISQGNWCVDQGRKLNLVTFGRWWNGNHHIHLLDPACPTMSPEAEDQMVQFGNGETGLVGIDKDPWDRRSAAAIMKLYANRNSAPTPAPAPAPVPGAKVDYTVPYQLTAGWYPYPGKIGASYYGPSHTNTPWYSGKVAGGSNQGVGASGALALSWVRGHIQRIQKVTGTRITSLYEVNTVNAVIAWQKRNGLTPDGIVGPKTWAAMARSKNQGK